MKLLEIFDTDTKERTTKDLGKYDKSYYRDYERQNPTEIGHGKFSYVKDKKSDPHFVQKVMKKASDDLSGDAYYVYIKTIVDQKIAQHNPFAPRVYKINQFKGTDGKQKYSIDMEKLIPLDDISQPELQEYARRLFDIDDEVNMYDFSSFVEDAMHGRIELKDKNLLKLFNLINSIKEKYGFYDDLHAANMMFRRGPYGIQLVITDPLAHMTE